MGISKSWMRVLLLGTAAGLTLQGCATDGQPMTTEQRIASCAVLAGLGGLAGGLLTDGKTEGILAGAALAGGACAVWQAFDSEQDKQRIAQMQMAAATTGQSQTQTWIGQDGRPRSVMVQPQAETDMAAAGDSGGTEICRPMNTTASVSGQSQTMAEIWCRQPDGSYAPRPASGPVV